MFPLALPLPYSIFQGVLLRGEEFLLSLRGGERLLSRIRFAIYHTGTSFGTIKCTYGPVDQFSLLVLVYLVHQKMAHNDTMPSTDHRCLRAHSSLRVVGHATKEPYCSRVVRQRYRRTVATGTNRVDCVFFDCYRKPGEESRRAPSVAGE